MLHKHTKVIAIISLALLLLGVGVLSFSLYTISNLEHQLDEERVNIALAHKRADELGAIERLVIETAEERATLSSYVLENHQVIEFLDQLQRMSGEQQVTFKTESLNAVNIDGVFEELEIAALVTGHYDSVVYTIEILEMLPYQSRISDVSLSQSGEGGADTWSAKFILRVTKFKEV